MFELGARPHPPRQVYRAYLAQSQVFVGVYWQSYGWVAPGEEMSGLEDEYRLSAGMPRLIYVKSPAPDREPRLTEMLARIKNDDSVSYQRFSDPAELQRLVENDLAVLLSERFEMTRPQQPRSRRWPARSPGARDAAGRPRAGNRRGGRPGGPAGRPPDHPHRPGRGREEPARGGGRRAGSARDSPTG